MRLPVGSTLGPYEISGPLGAGGMGEVYRARDSRLGREVAIKILPHEVADDAERLARFEREARTASALNHPNIVTIHDFTARDDETWLVMELVRGSSLRELMRSGPLPLKKLTTIGAGIAAGLAAAHAAGIVHRDLKPENVMITDDGIPKILDFGLVKQMTAGDLTDSPTEPHLSRAGVTLGTAAYMSPEQARGVPVDFRSDHFSLGIMLYEMATGRHPFRRGTVFETVAAIVNDEPPPPDASLPEPVAWIIERCLSKNPAERYGSTADLAYDLSRMHVPRTASAPRRPSRWIAPVLAAAAVIAIAIAAALQFRRAPAGFADPMQVDVAMPQLLAIAASETFVPVSISPNGRYLVVNGTDVNGKSQIWLRDLDTGTTRLIADDAFAPSWSADGKGIAFFSGGKLKSIGLEGGPPRIICDAQPQGTPSWRGDTILFGQYSFDDAKRRGIYRVKASGGTPEAVVGWSTKPRLAVPFWPELLPDGKHFLYVSLNPDRSVDIRKVLMVGSLEGDEPRVVPEVSSRAIYVDGWLLFVRDGTLMAQRFDPGQARLIGEASPIVDDVHFFRNTGLAALSASQNGVLAWRSARPASRLVWVDRGGLEVESIATAPFDTSGRLSDDGKRYTVGVIDPKQGVSDIWIYELDRGSSERVTFRTPDEKSPVWARDGRTIYCRSDGHGGPPDIVRIRPGEDQPSLFYRGPTVEAPQDVSPDGKWLLFISFFVGGSDINVLPLDPPGPPHSFAATPFDETAPRFSPDGQWVAYASDLSGRPEIYVRRFEGSDAARRISRDGGTRPRWRRDGKELYFLGAQGRVMVVPVDRDFGAPRLLFQSASAADFEPAADGSRFLMQLQQDSSSPPVHLLINWQTRARANR